MAEEHLPGHPLNLEDYCLLGVYIHIGAQQHDFLLHPIMSYERAPPSWRTSGLNRELRSMAGTNITVTSARPQMDLISGRTIFVVVAARCQKVASNYLHQVCCSNTSVSTSHYKEII